ncbi:efflux RND transporter periplasmic adaptor subunit [Salinisphaera sp. T31B1]|uniref:efflux RND transporter periplasmic adaptor subunit n=1 Tax=Salinisphaera sp. T31B1 TaxID=727963 RepID=UPI00334240D5
MSISDSTRVVRAGCALCLSLLGLAVTGLAAEPALVSVAEVEQRRWRQTVPLHGTLTSPRDARLTPRLAGLVERVDVDAGDRVRAGDTLIVLDRRLDELTLDTLIASVAEARAARDEARRLLRESRQLGDRGAVSATELAARRSQLAIRQANLDRLEAEAARQRERLERHAVLAPFDGVVRERLVEPGEYVAETTAVVGLVAIDRLRLDVAAPQQYYDLIRPGMPVRILPEAGSERVIEAAVDVTVPASDAQARSFLVRIFVDNDAARLTPGMSARVLFDLQTDEHVRVAPRDALVRMPGGGGTRMWVIRDDTAGDGVRAVMRQVSLGRSADGWVEILAGVQAGEQVVVRGNESLGSDQPVRVRQDRGVHTSAADPPAVDTGGAPGAERRSLRLSAPDPQ